MAKRKQKKSTFNVTLKYEVYGILFIIFSIITLAGQDSLPGIGAVGRALSSLCLFLMGQIYFVIPLIFIWLGLYVMVKRKWPRKWTYRMTGITLGCMAMLITFHMNLFGKLHPVEEYATRVIFSQSYEYITDMLFSADTELIAVNIGGGMIGAVLYGSLHFFFGYMGSMLIVIASFIIAFILITGLSFVELMGKLRKGISSTLQLLRTRWKQMKRKSGRPVLHDEKLSYDAAENDAFEQSAELPEQTVELEKPMKKPILLELIKAKEEDVPEVHADEPKVEEKESNAEDIPLYRDFQSQFEPVVEQSLNDPELDPDEVIIRPELLDSEQSEEPHADAEQVEQVKQKPYQLPPFHLITRPEVNKNMGDSDYKSNARKLEATLESFGVRTKVLEVVRGPSVTRYEIQPDIGVKVSRIVSLTDDIALALAAKDIRMEAPIPGKAAIGIEVPNTEVSVVTMREVMESAAFMKSDSKLSITLGRDIAGQPIIGNLAKMPHLLVAGATGSGKSVCINAIIVSILYKAKPNEVKFLMIDPKKVELNVYNGIPHLLAPVVTDPRRASLALKKVVSEMEKRYELFSETGTRNIEGYNEIMRTTKEAEPLPYIVVIVDELADLMMVAAKEVEDNICRLAQMARAAGIHLIIATQRPSVDVITGLIKANIPSRIAFGVSSQVDSRTILDSVGAEKLLGRGDMLFLPVGASKSIRVQGAFLSDQEVEAVVQFVKGQATADYQEEMVPEVDEEQNAAIGEHEDELFEQAVQIIVEAKQASVSLLQRRMRIGYTRAARLIDSMEAKGVVGPYEGSKPREVLMTMEQFQQKHA